MRITLRVSLALKPSKNVSAHNVRRNPFHVLIAAIERNYFDTLTEQIGKHLSFLIYASNAVLTVLLRPTVDRDIPQDSLCQQGDAEAWARAAVWVSGS